MNFFGHAIVASWHSRSLGSPGFVLGAMLPDFATMIGARVPPVSHPELASGVGFHHATDRVFHESRGFRELELAARRRLRELGVPRPGALAVGHIGVEILIDAALSSDDAGVRSYLSALEEGQEDRLGAHIDWERGSAARFQGLRRILEGRGVPKGAADPSAVTLRVTRALSSRPRLRLDDAAALRVHAWVEEAAAGVGAAVPALIHEIATGLSLQAVSFM